MHKMRSLLRQATRTQNEVLNILTFSTHERYQQSMAECGHTFYLLQIPGQKSWNTTYAPIPSNYTLLNEDIPTYLNIDIVLSQSRQQHYMGAKKLAEELCIPLVNLQHTLPPPDISPARLHEIQSRQGFIDVFVSPYSQQQWGSGDDEDSYVNMTGIDTDVFHVDPEVEKDGTVITVANQFSERDAELGFKEWIATTNFPEPVFSIKILGNTPGLSKPARSMDELVNAYQSSVLYLNTTIVSTLPTVIIEAMACGLPIVSTGTCLIPETLVEHGVNGFISPTNDPMELRHYCTLLLSDNKLARQMGEASRQKVEREFTVERFANTWDEIFRKAASMRTA